MARPTGTAKVIVIDKHPISPIYGIAPQPKYLIITTDTHSEFEVQIAIEYEIIFNL